MNEKCIDSLGRIVIPKVFRNELGLKEGTPVCFQSDPKSGVLIIKKSECACLKCNGDRDLIEICDKVYLCSECINRIVENL